MKKIVILLLVTVVFALWSVNSFSEMSYKEAPMLADMVKAGNLPPVEQRLPKQPLVIQPHEEIGQYGGTLRRGWLGPSDGSNVKRLISQRLVRFNPDVTEIVPNLVSKWETSEGGKVFTFYLREGTKWSDGEPFTADDLVFWYEDMIMNEELTPRPPAWMKVGGELGKVEKVSDYVVQFRFSQPYGLFMKYLCASQGYNIFHPKHYLQQFHPKYTAKEELDKMVKEAGFDHWFELFRAKSNGNNGHLALGHPTLNPWVATTAPSAVQFVMERNPYYYKVDPEGNQLPYIDKIVFDLTENKEVINLKAMTGEIDFQFRHIIASNYTVLKENEDKENYRLLEYLRDLESDCIITLNISHKDPTVRQVIGDKRFRIALSYAINREEINELAYGGLAGEPRQASPFPESPYFLPEFAYAYIEYDPDQANTLLDEMGMTERDGDGFRLRPDGETMTLTIEYAPVFGPWNDVAELTKEYWENIGIKTAMKPIERSLWQERYEANELEVSMWSGTAGMMPLTWPRYYVPTGGQVLWGRAFQLWYETGGKSGEEPPDYIKKAIDLFEEIKVTVDEQKQAELFKEILKIKQEHLWDIGTLAPPPYIGVVSDRLRNVPETSVYSDIARSPGSFLPEQFFYKN